MTMALADVAKKCAQVREALANNVQSRGVIVVKAAYEPDRQPSTEGACRGAARASGKFLHVMWLCAQRTTSPSPLLWSGPNVQLLDHTAMSQRKERLEEDEVDRGGARREHNQSGAGRRICACTL
jgi:hypothetical protein